MNLGEKYRYECLVNAGYHKAKGLAKIEGYFRAITVGTTQ